jgi:serine/threonine protein kinase
MSADQSIIGKVIDKFQILGILGRGGMGVVYKAKDMTLDRDVALKMIDPALARSEDFLKRFRSEAKALAKLQSPNIVGAYALQETELGLCLVMEFVDGETLAARIQREGAMPVQIAGPVFRQLITALDHAHKVGVIHRDIKPSNIMLTREDVAKLTDFGLARVQVVKNSTVTIGTAGTLYYMSPEQLNALAGVDARGDIYSLGMTLYETLVGRVPFDSKLTDFEVRQAIVEGKIQPPAILNPNIGESVNDVIMKAIARDAGKRFQSASEMGVAFVEATESKLRTRTQSQTATKRLDDGDRARRRSMVWTSVASGILILLWHIITNTDFRLPGFAFNAFSPSKETERAQPVAASPPDVPPASENKERGNKDFRRGESADPTNVKISKDESAEAKVVTKKNIDVRKPIASSPRIAVVIAELRLGKTVANSYVQGEISAELGTSYEVVDAAALYATVPKQQLEKAIQSGGYISAAKRLSTVCEFVIVGTVSTEQKSNPFDGIFFCSGEANFTLVQTATGRVLATIAKTYDEEPGETYEDASRKLLMAFAPILKSSVQEKLVRFIPTKSKR